MANNELSNSPGEALGPDIVPTNEALYAVVCSAAEQNTALRNMEDQIIAAVRVQEPQPIEVNGVLVGALYEGSASYGALLDGSEGQQHAIFGFKAAADSKELSRFLLKLR